MKGLGPPAQRQCAEVAGLRPRQRAEGRQRIRRCDEEASDFAGRLLEASRRVHDVAVEDDRTAHLADLAGDDFTQMQGRAQLRLHAEALAKRARVAASASRIAKKQRSGRASGTPSASTQVMTTSSPTYW
jgi:hypothetical protein